MSPKRHKRRKIALLIVHGIGKQKYGATLTDVVTCFQDAVEEEALAKLSADEQTDPGEKRIKLTHPGEKPLPIYFKEAYWHDKVTPPASHAVILWALLSVPVFLFQSVGAWIKRYESYNPEVFDDSLWTALSLRRKAQVFGRQIVILGVFLGVFLFAPALLAVLLILLLFYIALYVFARNSGWYTTFNEVLTLYIGDALVYVSEEQEENTIDLVSKQLTALQNRGYKVFLVAHSQGAEISRRVIVSGKVPEGFIAVGSGQHQLTTPRIINRNKWYLPVLWIVLLGYPIFFNRFINMAWEDLKGTISFFINSTLYFVESNLVPYTGKTPRVKPDIYWGSETLIFTSVTLACLIFLLFVVRKFFVTPDDVEAAIPCRAIYVRSPYDPVAFGQGMADEETYTVMPSKRSNILLEHVRYWEKPETGRAILSMILSKGLTSTEPEAKSSKLASRLLKFSALLLLALSTGWGVYALGGVI